MKTVRAQIISNAILTSSTVPEADYAAYNAGTTYALNDYAILVNPASTVTISNASPAVVAWTGHALPLNTPVVLTTTGTLPAPLVAGATYYISAVATNSFEVASELNGAPINTTSAGSGTHTCTASVHKIYQSLAGSNVGNYPPATPAKWLDCGATNRWKMFDGSVTSQTSNPSSIVNVFAINGRIDSVAVLNTSAASVTITMTDAVDGVIYNQTYSLVADSGITDWYAYFFEPIVRVRDFVVTDLPPYANATVSVTLTDTGNTVLCGAMILGLSKDWGNTQAGASFGIQDYSIKTQDTFGNYTILQRAFRKTCSFPVWVDNTLIDDMQYQLAAFRATPTLYIGTASYGATIIYGFYRTFNVLISYPTISVCTIDLEGLT